MCGIVAFFSRHQPISEPALRQATRSLEHRGPDGQRQWMSPDSRVGLGHARLSIIDLTTGDQPIASEDGAHPDRRQRRILRLRSDPARARRLAATGCGPARTAKSRFTCMRSLGCTVPASVAGRICICHLGRDQPTIFAARDRFGIKPLFYAFHNETLYLASEVKALFAAGVPARGIRRSVYQSCRVSAATRCARFMMACSRSRRATT